MNDDSKMILDDLYEFYKAHGFKSAQAEFDRDSDDWIEQKDAYISAVEYLEQRGLVEVARLGILYS